MIHSIKFSEGKNKEDDLSPKLKNYHWEEFASSFLCLLKEIVQQKEPQVDNYVIELSKFHSEYLNEIENCRNEIERYRQVIKKLERENKELKEKNCEIRNFVEEYNYKFQESQAQYSESLSSLKVKLQSNLSELAERDSRLSRIEEESSKSLDNATSRILELETVMNLVKSEYLQREQETVKIVEKIKDQLSSLQITGSDCSINQKSQIVSFIDQLLKLHDSNCQESLISFETTDLFTTVNVLNNTITTLKSKHATKIKKYKEKCNNLDDYTRKISLELTDKALLESNLNQLTKQVHELETNLERFQQNDMEHQSIITNQCLEIDNLKKIQSKLLIDKELLSTKSLIQATISRQILNRNTQHFELLLTNQEQISKEFQEKYNNLQHEFLTLEEENQLLLKEMSVLKDAVNSIHQQFDNKMKKYRTMKKALQIQQLQKERHEMLIEDCQCHYIYQTEFRNNYESLFKQLSIRFSGLQIDFDDIQEKYKNQQSKLDKLIQDYHEQEEFNRQKSIKLKSHQFKVTELEKKLALQVTKLAEKENQYDAIINSQALLQKKNNVLNEKLVKFSQSNQTTYFDYSKMVQLFEETVSMRLSLYEFKIQSYNKSFDLLKENTFKTNSNFEKERENYKKQILSLQEEISQLKTNYQAKERSLALVYQQNLHELIDKNERDLNLQIKDANISCLVQSLPPASPCINHISDDQKSKSEYFPPPKPPSLNPHLDVNQSYCEPTTFLGPSNIQENIDEKDRLINIKEMEQMHILIKQYKEKLNYHKQYIYKLKEKIEEKQNKIQELTLNLQFSKDQLTTLQTTSTQDANAKQLFQQQVINLQSNLDESTKLYQETLDTVQSLRTQNQELQLQYSFSQQQLEGISKENQQFKQHLTEKESEFQKLNTNNQSNHTMTELLMVQYNKDREWMQHQVDELKQSNVQYQEQIIQLKLQLQTCEYEKQQLNQEFKLKSQQEEESLRVIKLLQNELFQFHSQMSDIQNMFK